MPISLLVNCGFARTAIRELSTKHKGQHHKRADAFKEQFQSSTFQIPENYFQITKHDSTFNRRCERILSGFAKRWHPSESRKEYLDTFSKSAWQKLTKDEREKHTLSKCSACALEHSAIQATFPLKPIFECTSTLDSIYKHQGTSKTEEASVTRQVLTSVNLYHKQTFGKSLTQSVTSLCPEEQIEKKRTPAEKKKERRTLLRKIRNKENQELAQTSMNTVFAENQSLSGYNRKRKATCFEVDHKPKTPRSHIPTISSAQWDKEAVLAQLVNMTENTDASQTPVNWSAIARQHGVPGANRGQIVKEFARKEGIDVSKLDGRQEGERQRARKRRMLGGEISVPCTPTVPKLKKQRQEMIDRGELHLGIPCSPNTVTRTTVKEGQIIQEETQVYGRKIPLLQLRQKILENQSEFMRLESDEQIDSKPHNELLEHFKQFNVEQDSAQTVEQLREKLKEAQRTRHLLFWHDHATILGRGYVMVTVTTIYNPLLYLTQDEYVSKKGKRIQNLQALIEEPHVYLLAHSSSSVADQLSLIADRVDCLYELSKTTTTSTGIHITDCMRFFCGDKPAQNFERGTQQGGNYKCGACGIKSTLIEDQAHSLRCSVRSLSDLQQLILSGVYGKRPGMSKPLTLNANQLRDELRARGVSFTNETADILRQKLVDILQGAQRVPTLLIHNPSQTLSALNLQQYTVLDCEPLHSLKGHLLNLYEEIPEILEGDLKLKCTQVLNSHIKKEKITGADARSAAIHLLILFQDQGNRELAWLMETIVRVSCLLQWRF